MNNAYNIYYDMQRNSFYRINKTTGQQMQTYLNGENLPTFKPNITGFYSHKRKKTADFRINSRHQSPKQPQYSPNPFPKLDLKTISYDASLTSSPKQNVKLQKTINRDGDGLQTQRSNGSNFSTKFQFFTTKYSNQMTVKEPIESELSSKIKMFERLSQRKVRENNSPKKDIDGSVQVSSILDKKCITKINFSKLLDTRKQRGSNDNKNKESPKKADGNNGLPEQYKVQNQVKQQLLCRTYIVGQIYRKDEYKNIERERVRKQNLKRLEKDMLKKNSISQSHAFNSEGEQK